jgi:hypothetical protein
MDIETILANLKELTLDFVEGQRTRIETVLELNKRIDPNEIYGLDESIPQNNFITEVFVSLNSLTEEGFATSFAEMQYFAECFEGKRTFSQEEVRKFPIGPFEKENNRKPAANKPINGKG